MQRRNVIKNIEFNGSGREYDTEWVLGPTWG
jgi:hypothetical protein